MEPDEPCRTRAFSTGSGLRSAGSALDNEWRIVSIGRLLAHAQRRFELRMFELMAQAGYTEARLIHLTLTRNLGVEGARASELARRAGITKQAMGELITSCEEMGLVVRRADPADARAKIVCFTPKGLEWLKSFRAASDQAEQEMCEELGLPRLDELKGALRSYAGHLDPFDEADRHNSNAP